MKLTGWRVARRAFCRAPHRPFDGTGAALHGGRWNSPQTRVAYASSSLSLATLEYLAHIDREDAPTDLVRVAITFDQHDLEQLEPPYPTRWDGLAPSTAARHFGDRWVKESRSLVLAVPSVVVPTETNYLINPAHPRMRSAKIGPLQDYPLDERLLRP